MVKKYGFSNEGIISRMFHRLTSTQATLKAFESYACGTVTSCKSVRTDTSIEAGQEASLSFPGVTLVLVREGRDPEAVGATPESQARLSQAFGVLELKPKLVEYVRPHEGENSNVKGNPALEANPRPPPRGRREVLSYIRTSGKISVLVARYPWRP